MCVQTVVWLPALGFFNVLTDVDACDCAQGAVQTPEKPASVLRLAFQSDAVPTQLSQSRPLGNVVCEKKGLGYSRTLCEKERGIGNHKTIKQFIGIPHTSSRVLICFWKSFSSVGSLAFSLGLTCIQSHQPSP